MALIRKAGCQGDLCQRLVGRVELVRHELDTNHSQVLPHRSAVRFPKGLCQLRPIDLELFGELGECKRLVEVGSQELGALLDPSVELGVAGFRAPQTP